MDKVVHCLEICRACRVTKARMRRGNDFCVPAEHCENTRLWIDVLHTVQEHERLTHTGTYHFKFDVTDHQLLPFHCVRRVLHATSSCLGMWITPPRLNEALVHQPIGLNFGKVTSSLTASNQSSTGRPMRRSSGAIPVTHVARRGPSSNSTTTAAYGTASANAGSRA